MRGGMLLTDPWFYASAVPAVLIMGISKGGFGGGLGILAVPLLSLVIGPVQAAAILLPILCVMDLIGVWAYRGHADPASLRIMLPGAVAGITLGSLTFGLLDETFVRLLLGVIAVTFSLDYWLRRRHVAAEAQPQDVLRGGFWGAVSGFTSFIAHAGGAPLQVYLLPRQLDKTLYQGTTVIFFIVVNYVKLIPYSLLGQLGDTNLELALVLLPLAALGMGLGIWLHKRVPAERFYQLCYAFLLLTGLRLLYESLSTWLI